MQLRQFKGNRQMKFIFKHGRVVSTPTQQPLQVLGPVLGGSGQADCSLHAAASAPQASRDNLTPQALQRPSPEAPALGASEAPPGRGSSAGDFDVQAADRALPVLRPAAAQRDGCPAGLRGPGAGRPQKCGLPPPTAATPPPAPAACTRVSVCLSALSTSVGISSQEVRE